MKLEASLITLILAWLRSSCTVIPLKLVADIPLFNSTRDQNVVLVVLSSATTVASFTPGESLNASSPRFEMKCTMRRLLLDGREAVKVPPVSD